MPPSARVPALLLASFATLAGAHGCASAAPPREAAAGDGVPEGPNAPPEVAPPETSAAAAPLPLPGPAPRPPLEPVAGIGLPTDESCARCHDEIAAEWQASLHRRSWQNAYFTRSYATEPQAFCRSCHAPSADPSAEPPLAARETGVGCTTCHVVTSGVVGVHARRGSADGHEVIGDARLATPAACGACHEFAFPGSSAGSAPMQQDTLSEHRQSAAAETTCQDCHMTLAPSRGGGTHRSHAFRVQGDPAMLAQAVKVESATLDGGELRIAIAPGKIGHAFPTGDVFRRAEVRVTPIDASGRALAAASTEVLTRTFGPAPGPHGGGARALRSDTRLVTNRILVLPVPPATRRARWQIVWQRLPPSLAERLGMTMSDHETVVLEGTVSR